MSSKTAFQKREKNFDLGNLGAASLKEYNALFDPNMRHFFENKKVQQHLYRTGQIDSHGRVIDIDKNKSRIFILEKEFQRAEQIEQRRMKEELDMRYQVQRKRFNELERVRKEEILSKLKADRELSNEIITIMRATSSANLERKGVSPKTAKTPSTAGKNSLSNAGFFITDKEHQT